MSKLSRPSLLVLSAMMLTGCAHSQDSPPLVELNVQITHECERLRPSKKIPTIERTTDYKNLSVEALTLLKQRDRQGDRYASCILRVIDQYAGAAK